MQSGNEPGRMAGVATHTLEILEERPDSDVILVPVGGGSGAAAACIAAMSIRSDIEVSAVQSSAAPVAHDSWRARAAVERTNTTIAEGLATRTAFDLPQRILRDMLDDFVLVTDDELLSATAVMIEKTRTLVEPPGPAPLAPALSPAVKAHLPLPTVPPPSTAPTTP